MLAKHCTSLFQPQYVDGLLNPSHRILSFTTDMHVDSCITSLVNIDSRSNIIDPIYDTEIVENQQILESCNTQF